MDGLTLFSVLGHKKSLLHSCMNEETPRKFTAKTLPRGSGLLFPPLAFSCLCFYPVKFIVLLASRAPHSCWPPKKRKRTFVQVLVRTKLYSRWNLRVQDVLMKCMHLLISMKIFKCEWKKRVRVWQFMSNFLYERALGDDDIDWFSTFIVKWFWMLASEILFMVNLKYFLFKNILK
jgi:hypothetical protein